MKKNSFSEVSLHSFLDTLTYGINTIDQDELFRLYQMKLLYPEKLSQLSPVFDQIVANYRTLLENPRLAKIVTFQEPQTGYQATIMSLRTSHNGWFIQHLAADGGKYASAVVILKTFAMAKGDYFQTMFRPENKFTARLFGMETPSKINQRVQKKVYSLDAYSYVTIPQNLILHPISSVRIHSYSTHNRQELLNLMSMSCDEISLYADGWFDDWDLSQLNSLAKPSGMHWHRSVWLAYWKEISYPLGALVYYESPLGLNFRFLTNRFNLFLDSHLADLEKKEICAALLQKAMHINTLPALGYLPGLVSPKLVPIIQDLGGTVHRYYQRACSLPEGLPYLYELHLERYQKIFYRYAVSR